MKPIPPVFKFGQQEHIYNLLPAPTIEFPVSEGETDEFPRHCAPLLRESLKHDFKFRRRYYQAQTSVIARNARRKRRNGYIFILKPNTMDLLLNELDQNPRPNREEAKRVLQSLYYQGITPKESESQISEKTLSRYLIEAERMAGVLKGRGGDTFRIGLSTIKVSYQVLRYGRDGLFDVGPFFNGRIF